jgi:small subunit ribosomal protein S11e
MKLNYCCRCLPTIVVVLVVVYCDWGIVLFSKRSEKMVKKTETKYVRPAAIDVAIQVERAYQKQTAINENRRKPAKKNVNQRGKARYFKSVGLGFRTPRAAVEGTYIDKKCPFTGDVSIRGRMMRGVVHSTKMKRSIVIRRNYLHYVQKYQRYMKRHKNFNVHCTPAFEPRVGDEVIVGQCRPLSKTVRYNVLEVIRRGGDGGKKFAKH